MLHFPPAGIDELYLRNPVQPGPDNSSSPESCPGVRLQGRSSMRGVRPERPPQPDTSRRRQFQYGRLENEQSHSPQKEYAASPLQVGESNLAPGEN